LTPRPSKCAPSGVGRPSSMTIIPVLRLGPRQASAFVRSGWNDRARRAPGRGRLLNLVKDCLGEAQAGEP
jgi:hypothetical protein